MPEKKEIYTVQGYDAQNLIVLCYGTFKRLIWEAAYAGTFNLIGYSLNEDEKRREQIDVVAQDGW